jgi:two-component system phosphate regulon response regulator PhoB
LAATVFVLEDDPHIAKLVRHHLEAAGNTVRAFTAPAELLAEVARNPPGMFLLDIMVPGGDGFSVCRRIRGDARVAATPVIFLTARGRESDRVTGLELGADDYIVKPFSPRELVARVRAVLRRFERLTAPNAALQFGAVELDPGAMQLKVNGKAAVTTTTEFRLLEYFVRHPGRVFTRDHLLDAVWGGDRFVTSRSVDVYVRRIREKIEPRPDDPQYLKTVRGAGYRFEIPKER